MRRYHVTVAGHARVIDVQELSAQEFRVNVEGHEIDVTLSGAEDVAETIISPELMPRGAGLAPSTARFRPANPESLPPMLSTALPPLPPAPDLATDGVVKSPMPGTITSVDVQPGDAVVKGQVLVRLEAMKMVNAIRAPHDGRVATVQVQAAESVGYGQVLVTLEEAQP